MRWLWIDRFTKFVSGQQAEAVKNVTIDEEVLDRYLPHFPMFPPSLIIEGLAHTGGLLVGEMSGFRDRVVLAKVGKAVFHRPVFPGDQLCYRVTLQDRNEHGAIVEGAAYVEEATVAEVDLMFAHLDDRFPEELFSAEELVQLLHAYRLFEVATTADGQPIAIPERLLQAAQKNHPQANAHAPTTGPQVLTDS
jgi:3-hydroxyacyl-[acyl-carrier-protein] dehydratase